ncbi:hypothetical protein RND81_07G197100 [Saponaria officinalis]|uniref:Uncharacterized protein n=1 Tax=Saponaria officinalis TaxID=3572 RepID=A0AAW1JUY7_SAPOF
MKMKKMSKIESFYQNLCHDESIEEQIMEAQRNGIILSYFLTTKSAMNARRVTDVCLWCDEEGFVDHHCEYAPDYNCMFSFGEDDDGFALVKISKDDKKLFVVDVEAPVLSAENMFDEVSKPDTYISQKGAVVSGAQEVFDEMPVPDFILEMAQLEKTSQVEFGEEDEGFASVMVSTEVLNPSAVIDLQAEVQITYEPKLLDEICETNPRFQPDLAPISAVHQVFDEMPIPNFILEMAQSAKITQAHNTLHEIDEPKSSISEEVPPISDACHMFDDLSTAKMEFLHLPSSESMEFLHLSSSEFMENLRVTSAQPFPDAMREPDYKSNTELRTLGTKSMIQGALNQREF